MPMVRYHHWRYIEHFIRLIDVNLRQRIPDSISPCFVSHPQASIGKATPISFPFYQSLPWKFFTNQLLKRFYVGYLTIKLDIQEILLFLRYTWCMRIWDKTIMRDSFAFCPLKDILSDDVQSFRCQLLALRYFWGIGVLSEGLFDGGWVGIIV